MEKKHGKKPVAPVATGWFEALAERMTDKVTAAITVAADGKKWEVPAAVGQVAREGFVHGVHANAKFTSIESDVSGTFGAPDCYTDRESPGREGLKLFLRAAFPAYTWAAGFVAAQELIGADKRDAIAMANASSYIESAGTLITQRIGYLYNAYKARMGLKNAPSETVTPADYVKLTVLPSLKKMTKSEKQTAADQRRAQFFYNWLTFAVEHRDAASAFLVANALGGDLRIAQPRTVGADARKAGLVLEQPTAKGNLTLSKGARAAA